MFCLSLWRIALRKFSSTARLTAAPNSDVCCANPSGLIIGAKLEDGDVKGESLRLTPSGERVNDKMQGRILDILKHGASPPPSTGQVRMIYGLDAVFPAIAVVGIGGECLCYNIAECIDEKKESIRLGIGAGVRAFQTHGLPLIFVDACEHAESAAEGASLGIWMYQELRHQSNQIFVPRVEMFDCCDFAGWRIGLEKAAAQNLARQLQETPRNLLTPSGFAQTAVEILSKAGICTEVKMRNWAKLRNLNAFLTVAKGSCEPPVFLEALYEGCDPDICPIIMIGKGTTFNTGGLCLKSNEQMKWMRGDLSGAACVIATLKAVASLQLPVNIRGMIPLCENSFGATSYKPGDVCSAINSKTVFIEDTNNEGILMLADTINYAKEFSPKFILDIGTMTREHEACLGSSASAVFCNSESLYETLKISSIHTGDRVWRMPLWNYFSEYVQSATISDLTNQFPPHSMGAVCKAAGFLREFLPNNVDWIHIDSFGVSKDSGNNYTYLREGMTGRPTRTLIEFVAQLACQIQSKTCQ